MNNQKQRTFGLALLFLIGTIAIGVFVILDRLNQFENNRKADRAAAEAEEILSSLDAGLFRSKDEFLRKRVEEAQLREKSLFAKKSTPEQLALMKEAAGILYDLHYGRYETEKELDRINRN